MRLNYVKKCTFAEHTHVAYLIKGSDESNVMVPSLGQTNTSTAVQVMPCHVQDLKLMITKTATFLQWSTLLSHSQIRHRWL